MADLVGWVAGPTERGTLSLVWSCLITIFACTWTVLHLNVPGYYNKPRTILLRKLKWMAINVLFPEFILAKAICDLRQALHELLEFDAHLRECKKDITWTTQYGHADQVCYIKWSWKIEPPSGWSSALYHLLRLPPPHSVRQKPGIQDGASQMSRQDTEFRESAQEEHRRPSPICGAHLEQHQQHLLESELHHSNADMPGDCRFGLDNNDLEMGPTTLGRHSLGTKPQKISSREESAGFPNTHDELRVPLTYYVNQKWTITHSYYAQMGGLISFNPYSETSEKDVLLVTAFKLARWFQRTKGNDPNNDHPLCYLILEKEDIEDKSKADWFLKSLAILQVTWIMLNVIVRLTTPLPVTQLEVATVAFAIMAVLSYLANWWKPKDVFRPTILQFRGRSDWVYNEQYRHCAQSFMQRLRHPDTAQINAGVREQVGKRIANDIAWSRGEPPLLYYLMAGSSLIFGALHCLAWKFDFPAQFELICWRAASVTSSILPLMTLVIIAFLGYFGPPHLNRRFKLMWFGELEYKFGKQPYSKWWDLFISPRFLHDGDALYDLYSRPAASRDWESPPPPADFRSPLDRYSDEIPRSRSHRGSTQDDEILLLHRFWRDLENFESALSDCMAGTATEYKWQWLRRCDTIPSALKPRRIRRFWQQYETYARGKLGGPNLPVTSGGNTTILEEIHEVIRKTATSLFRSQLRLRRTSNAIFLTSLILYTASRLIILVILFTSLRAAPAGVYQDTVWTRFLPNFS